MFEDQTFEVIMERLLNRVPDHLDKREGSIIWDALSPAAAEIAQLYVEIDASMKETFAGTATRDFLIKRAAEKGIVPFPATKAILKGVFEDGNGAAFDVPVGARFNLDDLNYLVIEQITTGEFKVECETPGIIGNSKLGFMTPVDYIEGLGTGELTEVLILGEDEEGTEDLRSRYFLEISKQAQDGNVAQYLKWAAAYPGIGKAKVFPLWNGANTVKVSILNANNGVASQTLIDEFQEYLDPNSEGLGNGAAPIGSIVTVSTATAINLNLYLEVELAAGYAEASGIQEAIVQYFADLAYNKNTVSYLGLAGKIMDVPSVERLVSFTINAGTVDISLGSEQIPALGTFTCQVVTP